MRSRSALSRTMASSELPLGCYVSVLAFKQLSKCTLSRNCFKHHSSDFLFVIFNGFYIRNILHVPNVPCAQTCLPTWYQSMFLVFPGRKGLSLVRSLCTLWEALRNKVLAIQTCLWGSYQVRFFGLIFGILGTSGRGEWRRLVRYLCETRRALHERHVWKP